MKFGSAISKCILPRLLRSSVSHHFDTHYSVFDIGHSLRLSFVVQGGILNINYSNSE